MMNIGCLYQALNSSELESIVREVEGILSNLYFIYVTLGIVGGVIVTVGLICNLLVLVVLCNRLMLSAPTCLLQALTVNDIFTMLNSIYSDIQPAIKSYGEASSRNFNLDTCKYNNTNERLTDLVRNFFTEAFLNLTQSSLYGISDDILVENGSAPIIVANSEDMLRDISNVTFSRIQLQQNFTINFTVRGLSGGVPNDLNSDSLIIKALERFIAYAITTFGMAIMLALAVERSIAVLCPLKASSIVTVRRTRIAIIAIFIMCVIIHSFQFLKEVILVNHYPERIRSDYQGLILQSYRKDYERFHVIFCLIICVVLMVLNVFLLRKIVEFQKVRKKVSSVTKANQRNEMNVTFLIVTLIFLQLPVSVFTVVLSFISMEDFINNLTTITRLSTSCRIVIISSSAFNFIIYCFLSSKFRRIFVKVYCQKFTGTATSKRKLIGELQCRSVRTSSDNCIGYTAESESNRKSHYNGNPLRKDTKELILLMDKGVVTRTPEIHKSSDLQMRSTMSGDDKTTNV